MGKHKHDDKHQHTPGEEVKPAEQPAEEQLAGDEQKNETAENESAELRVAYEAQIAALNDKYLRLYSEFDNYRKRTLRERIELSKTASEEVITALLPVVDDLERAIKAHTAAGESASALTDGIILIYNKLMNILKQFGLEEIVAVGEAFTTDFHEAVTNVPMPDPEMKGKVVDEIQKGYTLNGKVIRFSKTVVGS